MPSAASQAHSQKAAAALAKWQTPDKKLSDFLDAVFVLESLTANTPDHGICAKRALRGNGQPCQTRPGAKPCFKCAPSDGRAPVGTGDAARVKKLVDTVLGRCDDALLKQLGRQ